MSGSNSMVFCKFTSNVDCKEEDRRCDKCGWNPEVKARRVEKIREKMTRRVPVLKRKKK